MHAVVFGTVHPDAELFLYRVILHKQVHGFSHWIKSLFFSTKIYNLYFNPVWQFKAY